MSNQFDRWSPSSFWRRLHEPEPDPGSAAGEVPESRVTKKVPKPDKTRQQENLLIPPLLKLKQWKEKSTNRSLASQQYDEVTSPISGLQLEELDTNLLSRASLLKTSGADDHSLRFENHGTIPVAVFKGLPSQSEQPSSAMQSEISDDHKLRFENHGTIPVVAFKGMPSQSEQPLSAVQSRISDDHRLKFENHGTIPVVVFKGIPGQTEQPSPAIQSEISDDHRLRFENYETIRVVVSKGTMRQPEMFLLGLALLLAGFFSLFLIGSKSLWFDEAYSVQLVHSWGSMWLELFSYDRNAWLYYTLLYGWTRLGDGETYVRVLSALFAIASLPVYYLLSKNLFGKKVALIAAFLLAVNGFYIRYAQEARAYSLYFFLSLLSTLIFLRLRHKQSKLLYFLYILCVALSIYAHALAVFLLAIHGLIVLFTSRSFWKQFAICAIITIACASPVLSHQGNVKDALGWLAPVDVLTLPRYFLTLSVGQPVLCLLYVIPCGIATVWIMRRMRNAKNHTSLWKYTFVYIWLFLPLLLTFFYSLLIHPLFSPRYLIIGLAPFLLLVSIGLTKITHRLLLYLCFVIIGVVSLLSLIGWYNGDQHIALDLGNKNEDWRTAVAYVCTNATVNDSVTFYAYFVHVPYDYYSQKSTMCLHKDLHEIELASAPYGSGGGGTLPAPNMLLLKNLPTSTSRVWLMISHDTTPVQRVAQSNMIQQMLAKNYSLVSVKKFEEIDVQLYTRSRSQEKVAATSCTVQPARGLFEMAPSRSREPQDTSGSLPCEVNSKAQLGHIT